MRSNFTAVVGLCGAKNQKMVLTNVVQDAILYLNMNCQHVLQKFPYPTTGCLFRLGIFQPLSTGYNTCSMNARLDLFYSKHLYFCDFRIKSTEILSKWQNLYFEIFPHFSPIAKHGAKA